MKLYNLMQELNSINKYYSKKGTIKSSFTKNGYTLHVLNTGFDLVCEKNDMFHAHSVFMVNVYNEPCAGHKNNASTNSGRVSSFFRMSFGEEIDLHTDDTLLETIELPRYNDNEDELLFTMSTITGASTPIVLSSILMTLDTHLCTLYTYRFNDSHIDILIELLKEAREWITPNTAI